MREDILDLSRIQEISKIEILCSLLPEKVGPPLSVQSLREDTSTSHDSLTRWPSYLRELYYYFEVSPD
jgi:predicted AAA+ superfamily ATPase